ncbi:alkylation response protein AidB-like acyl-CoA dehydrogenase [Geomicrobium halophilum]|uniref:Alkylation response protein AidB-like acyl-CoA dehydrogenase n=1 Tax=Geomicrobium halophilum TaxID=549000 RepID=A0A841Q257_9BACL|nr:acyl-CoA dehydrogenase family protein [Geomicrobium halophilum]MBB6450278.1 alkylation response protein AidB-like acyl-CoA dehydrogenase [Geomicrobium halophilum]
MDLSKCNHQEERMELLSTLVPAFKERAAKHDEEGSFPHENFRELQNANYPGLTVPKKYGGQGLSLTDFLELQEIIAQGDGSTALSIGWHMGIMMQLGENQTWDEETYTAVARDVVNNGALLNNAASEPATGSPTRGGRPETTATKTEDGWVITGRKTFTTLAPVLDYFVVSAGIENSDKVGNFLVHRSLRGVSIDYTWNTLGMRATGSDDLVLDQVQLKDEDYVQDITPGQKGAAGWLLHIPACYLGIAEAAINHSAEFANHYSPNSIEGTIADLPNIKQKIGEAELLRQRNRHFLYAVAKKWDRSDSETRQHMKTELGAVKYSVVNDALTMVDLSMRVEGAKSLQADNPLSRYYRDIRAGLHNPPMDDMTIMQLAGEVFARNKSE